VSLSDYILKVFVTVKSALWDSGCVHVSRSSEQ